MHNKKQSKIIVYDVQTFWLNYLCFVYVNYTIILLCVKSYLLEYWILCLQQKIS